MRTWHGKWQLTNSSCSARGKQQPLESWLDAHTKQIYGKVMAKSDGQRTRGEESRAVNTSSANSTLEEPGSPLGKTQYLMAGVTVLTTAFSSLSGL